MKVGFIGLGTMGKPMAENLLKAGFELAVYNRSPERAESFKDKAVIASDIAQLVAFADVIITIVSDDDAVKQILLGEGGVLEESRKQNRRPIVIDSSTVSPETSLYVAKQLAQAGIEMLDAPVTGSKPQAEQGVLTFIVGGRQEVYEKCMPLFEAMGKKAIHMGEQGSGARAKLANNMLTAVTLVALAESMTLVKSSGGSPEKFLEVVAGGGARCGMAEIKGPKILDGDFSPQFMTKLMHKDLRLAAKWAESLGVPAPALNVAKEMFFMAVRSGWGEEDMCAVIRNYENWAGEQVRK